MFLEIKPYQNVNLDDISGFAMYPGGEYGGRTLYVHLRGVKGNLQFSFNSEYECMSAYRRLRDALISNGEKMEDYKDAAHIY